MPPEGFAQSKTGIENYTLLRAGNEYLWMPVVHHTGKRGLRTEIRYNYEASKTASVYLGKSFSKDGPLSFDLTPMAGLVFGEYTGGSLALNSECSYKKFFFSTQAQYTINRHSRSDNFFFNWSELGFQPVHWFYAGLSSQYTRLHDTPGLGEWGFMFGVTIRKLTIPVYLFNPGSAQRNYIVGINVEW
jgi:hypothetical protein